MRRAMEGCLIGDVARALVPIDIIGRIKESRGRAMLAFLCRQHPAPVRDDALLGASGFLPGRDGHLRACVEFWLLRIEEDLPRAGWALARERYESHDVFRLVRI